MEETVPPRSALLRLSGLRSIEFIPEGDPSEQESACRGIPGFRQGGLGRARVAAEAVFRWRKACTHSAAQVKGLKAVAIFDFLRGEFIDVIHWTDDTRDTIVWRFERQGHAIKYGAKLTVREGQAAVFVHEGQLADTFGPGLYGLETNNMPILTTLQHWDHGFQSPFKSEIYFVNTRNFTDLKLSLIHI